MRVNYPRQSPSRAIWRASLNQPNSALLESLAASGKEALIRNPTLASYRLLELAGAEGKFEDIGYKGIPPQGEAVVEFLQALDTPSRMMSENEWRESSYYREGLGFPNGVREEVARIIAHRKDEEVKRLDVIGRAKPGPLTSGAMLATDLVASALDPLNVAAAFVPVVREARYAGWVARHGKTVARAARGAVEGLAGAAMVEPVVLLSSTHEQADYGMAESLINVGLGPLFGAGLHVGGGALADRLSKLPFHAREAALKTSVAQVVDDMEVNIDPVLRAEDGRIFQDSLEPTDRTAYDSMPFDEKAQPALDLPPSQRVERANENLNEVMGELDDMVQAGLLDSSEVSGALKASDDLLGEADNYGRAARAMAMCLAR